MLFLLSELPVVEIHQVTFRVPPDDKIEIMQARHIGYIGSDQCPTVTSTGTGNAHRGDLLSLEASQSYFQGNGGVVGGTHAGGEFPGSFVSEIDIAYLDVAAIPVAVTNTPTWSLRRLESFGKAMVSAWFNR